MSTLGEAQAHVSRAWLGNVAVAALLVAIAAALWRLQDGGWWIATPGQDRWMAAGALLLGYAGFCGWIAWRSRPRHRPSLAVGDAQARVLVAYASQTGFAQQLAERTADLLVTAGITVDLRSLAQLDANILSRCEQALFVVSTTGEGDPPDAALAFVRDTLGVSMPLASLRYGLLALGDREYAHFCGFGHALDSWLRRNGATALFDLIEVDNGDAGSLRHWQHHLGLLADAPDLPDWQAPSYTAWRLAERTHLNPGSAGGACFHLSLAPSDGALPAWEAGDIAEIGPRNTPAAVDIFLASSGHHGNTMVAFDGGHHSLADALARSGLPTVGNARNLTAQALADTLQPLPHREYSIASLPGDGAIHLLLRQMRRPDGSLGLGSGWLTTTAAVGDTVALRIRSNPGFHAPADDRPLILIGNGTGLAGLRALLKARIAEGRHRNWLLFGERSRAHDLHYGDDLALWQAQGWLERCDYAFSRDQPERRYVQHLLVDHAPALQAWLAEGAAVHVCGSLAGMAPAVDAELARLVGRETLERMAAEGCYRRDVY
ncbi:MAG: flavodoxin domain-containing protein [Luteimonas sp.]|nr:flavodoxin domain-containing protein [Luteimonas sp.]